MRMMVKCGDQDCRDEFYVESKEPVWECPSCGREINNRNYPFLSAKLMQAKIDGDRADWKGMFFELLKTARMEINGRGGGREDIEFLNNIENEIKTLELTNSQWREKHDGLIEQANEIILSLEMT